MVAEPGRFFPASCRLKEFAKAGVLRMSFSGGTPSPRTTSTRASCTIDKNRGENNITFISSQCGLAVAKIASLCSKMMKASVEV